MRYEIKGKYGKQHRTKMFSGLISAKDLAAMWRNGALAVDIYSPENPDGYQRKETVARSRKVARFVSDKEHGMIPTSIIIFSRGPSGGIVESGGRMYIDDEKLAKEAEEYLKRAGGAPSNKTVLYVADGQHRVSGLSEAVERGKIDSARDNPYDVPVTILFWNEDDPERSSKMEEARQFYTINTEQKRMKTDLAYKFLFEKHQEEAGVLKPSTTVPYGLTRKALIPYARYVASFLSESPISPLHGKIIPVNETRRTSGGIISESSFTDSLQPIIRFAADRDLNLEQVTKLVGNFWAAAGELCPQAFDGDPYRYVLLKTPGVYSLHMFLPILLQRRPELRNVPSKEALVKALQNVGEVFTDDFWYSGRNGERGVAATFGAGAKAFQNLAGYIIDEIGQERAECPTPSD